MLNLSSDSKFIQFLNRLGELILLNLCFLLCCLPVVTVGAASAALYTVCTRFGTEREGAVYSLFFRSFLGSLKQGIPLWLLELLLGVVCAYLTLVFFLQGGGMHYAFIPFLVLLGLVSVVSGYVYPLLGQFENTLHGTLRNAVILSLGYLPRSVAVAAINAAPLVLLAVNPELFMRIGILWAFLFFSGAAYLNSRILRPVFEPFYSQNP